MNPTLLSLIGMIQALFASRCVRTAWSINWVHARTDRGTTNAIGGGELNQDKCGEHHFRLFEGSITSTAMQGAIGNPQCAKPQFKTADVDDYLRRIILQSVHKADLLYCTEDEMAKSIRIDLNNKLGGHWHVIVGRHFARYVVAEVGHLCAVFIFLIILPNTVYCYLSF